MSLWSNAMSRIGNVQKPLGGWGESQSRLPEIRQLSLTRNFVWVVLVCVVLLQGAPLMVGWLASSLLK
jgi:hypothetical protein